MKRRSFFGVIASVAAALGFGKEKSSSQAIARRADSLIPPSQFVTALCGESVSPGDFVYFSPDEKVYKCFTHDDGRQNNPPKPAPDVIGNAMTYGTPGQYATIFLGGMLNVTHVRAIKPGEEITCEPAEELVGYVDAVRTNTERAFGKFREVKD